MLVTTKRRRAYRPGACSFRGLIRGGEKTRARGRSYFVKRKALRSKAAKVRGEAETARCEEIKATEDQVGSRFLVRGFERRDEARVAPAADQ